MPFILKDSSDKDELNIRIANEAKQTHPESVIVVLDTESLCTTKSLLAEGIAPERIHIVEANYTMYSRIQSACAVLRSLNLLDLCKVHVHFTDLFTWLDFFTHQSGAEIGLVYADLMTTSISTSALKVLSQTRAKYLWITLQQRGQESVSNRIEGMAAQLYDTFPGRSLVYGYQREGGASMFTIGFRDTPCPTEFRPRKVRAYSEDGKHCLVQWHCYPKKTDWSWELRSNIARKFPHLLC